MTARDAQTWGASASARAAEEAVTKASKFPRCGRCVHEFHGLVCRFNYCHCETSWTDEGISA